MEPGAYILKAFKEGKSLLTQYSEACEHEDWETMFFMASNWDELVQIIGVYENVNMMIS